LYLYLQILDFNDKRYFIWYSLGIILSFMIGPVFFILLETSIIKGFRAALVFDLGVVLVMCFFIAVAYLGSYRLIQSLQDKPALFIFEVF
jgi:threonine/homoserine/homoserine lactone efflux protein